MEFEQQFASEEACREYLFQLRWPKGFRCPRCHHQKAWKTSEGLYYCVNCKYKTSVIAGTIFQDTSKPLKVWFRAMWYMTNQKQGVSALGFEPNSIVCTDDWNGYNQLQKCGYTHEVIRKTSEVGKNLLPSANIIVSLLKRWLLGIHQGAVRISHLDYYLDEFTFRFNRRTSKSRGKLFYRLVQQAAEVDPVLINNISSGRPEK